MTFNHLDHLCVSGCVWWLEVEGYICRNNSACVEWVHVRKFVTSSCPAVKSVENNWSLARLSHYIIFSLSFSFIETERQADSALEDPRHKAQRQPSAVPRPSRPIMLLRTPVCRPNWRMVLHRSQRMKWALWHRHHSHLGPAPQLTSPSATHSQQSNAILTDP